MSEPVKEPDAAHSPQEIGEAFAAQIGDKQWELDETDLLVQPPPLEADPPEALIPESTTKCRWPRRPLKPTCRHPLQIIEAMLFIGGQPLKPEKACQIIRA